MVNIKSILKIHNLGTVKLVKEIVLYLFLTLEASSQ